VSCEIEMGCDSSSDTKIETHVEFWWGEIFESAHLENEERIILRYNGFHGDTFNNVDLFVLALNRDHWWTLVSAVLNLWALITDPLAFASRPALGPAQPPVQCVPVVKRTHSHLMPRLRMSRSYTSSHSKRLHGV
jgi:hypothetical protein